MSISNLLYGNSYKLTCAGLDAGKNKITNVGPPTEDYDCPNKAYVDAQIDQHSGTLSQVLAAGNDGNGDDMLNIGNIEAKKLTLGSPANDNQTHEIYGSMKLVKAGNDKVCELKLCGGDGGNDYVNTASMFTMCSRTSEYMGDNYPDFRITVGNPTTGYNGQPIRFNVGAQDQTGSKNEFTMFQLDLSSDPHLNANPGYFTDFIRPVQMSGGIKNTVSIGQINQYSAGCPLQVHDSRVGSMASGSMFIEAGCTSDGSNIGWSAINWNGYFGQGGDKIVNPNKLRWRQVVDQRASTEKFTIDTWAGPTPVLGWTRNWLEFDAIEGYTEIGGALGIDYRPGVAELYVRPTVANVNLGASAFPWKNVYSTGGMIGVSDRNKKKDIKTISKGLDYIKKLRPVEYKMINGTSDRVHCGLISQEVEEVNKNLGDVDGKGNAIVVKAKKMIPDPEWVKPEGDENAKAPLVEGEDYDYFLRYEELISPLIKAVQELAAQNAALVARVEALENA